MLRQHMQMFKGKDKFPSLCWNLSNAEINKACSLRREDESASQQQSRNSCGSGVRGRCGVVHLCLLTASASISCLDAVVSSTDSVCQCGFGRHAIPAVHGSTGWALRLLASFPFCACAGGSTAVLLATRRTA